MYTVDSEHSAIFQCIQGLPENGLRRVILTASGGAFRDWPVEKLKTVKVADALKHPNWSMGRKITVDSATLMNKGLEVIEAHYLFGVDYDNIDIVIHPQSIIHSMVETQDSSVIAQVDFFPYADDKLDLQLPLVSLLHCMLCRLQQSAELIDIVDQNEPAHENAVFKSCSHRISLCSLCFCASSSFDVELSINGACVPCAAGLAHHAYSNPGHNGLATALALLRSIHAPPGFRQDGRPHLQSA